MLSFWSMYYIASLKAFLDVAGVLVNLSPREIFLSDIYFHCSLKLWDFFYRLEIYSPYGLQRKINFPLPQSVMDVLILLKCFA